jgi:predicted glycosyltransferase
VWLVYALGGGWGHLMRAVALGRAAQSRHAVRILTNSPYAAGLPEMGIEIILAGTREAVVQAIAGCEAECLIVDTFPRGLGGELATLRLDVPKVLVHRSLNPRYLEKYRLREFVAANYDLVLVPGPGEEPQFEGAVVTAAWLVRSADEIPAEVPVPDGAVVVCASGRAEELAWYGEVVAELVRMGCPAAVRCVAAERPAGILGGFEAGPKRVDTSVDAARKSACATWVRHWPAIDLFGRASVVIGGAGYNTVEECLAMQVPLISHPWPRMYDRQDLRARRASERGRVVVVDDPREAAEAALREIGRKAPRRPSFENGAVEAVAFMERLLRNHG